jgi:short-subunit dehydrogenase
MTDLRDKVVLITGASSGIGKAACYAFAKKGASVVLAARQHDLILELATEIAEKYRVKTLAVQTDVSREEDCKNLVGTAVKHFGRIDVLINNAGISMRSMFEDLDLGVLHRVMDINFWGTVYCTKYALPELIRARGTVAGISSIAGYKGLPGRSGYSASKFAMQGFLESVRIETLHRGLHVLVVCPGFTASNIRNVALTGDGSQQGESPLDEKKIMQPEEVARALTQAVEKRRRTLVLTGQGKLTVWLNKFFPGWMDKLVYNHFVKEENSPLKK